eukprot:6878227-Prymnesium_polylepis.1
MRSHAHHPVRSHARCASLTRVVALKRLHLVGHAAAAAQRAGRLVKVAAVGRARDVGHEGRLLAVHRLPRRLGEEEVAARLGRVVAAAGGRRRGDGR